MAEYTRRQLIEAHYTEDVVELSLLNIDPSYQRPTSPGRLRRMAPYDPDIGGTIDVNQRPDGSLWIMDGGHRAALARNAGEELIAAHLFHFRNVELEALFFHMKNRYTRPPTSLQRLRARMCGGDADAVAIGALVVAHGFTLDDRRTGLINGCSCAAALEVIYKRSPFELDAVLSLLEDSWGGKQGAAAEVMVVSVSLFLRRHGHTYDRKRFIKRVGIHEPLWLRAKAGEAHSARAGLTAETHLCNLLVDLYDSHLRSGRLVQVVEDER